MTTSSFAPHDLRLGLVQTDLQWQAAKQNRALLQDRMEVLAGKCDIIILPEMFTTAFALGSGAIAESFPGPTLQWMQEQAGKLGSAITGSIAAFSDGRKFNRLLFVTPDGNCRHYDKVHLFRMLGEDQRYAAGRTRLLLEYRGWRILPIVCYDLRFPVFCRSTGQQPWDLMICVANWPAARSRHWRTLLQARAIENLGYVAGVNRTGRDGNNLDYEGYSAVVSPLGEELLQAGTEAGIFTTTLSAAALEAWRRQFPAWMDADNFDLSLR
jgi:omega-amidase